MFIKVNETELNGQTMPYRIDNFVLGAIQQEFGRMEDFELKLMGWVKKDGKVSIGGEPSVSVVNKIFPLMVDEGFKCQDKENPYTDEEIIRMIDKTPLQMALLIHEEYIKCFETKKKEDETNKKPSQRKPRTTKSTS